MEFDEFEPVYEAIIADFGYPRDADRRARDRLAELVDPFDLDRLPASGTVAIAGAGPNLEAESGIAADADAVFAASTAADRLREVGVGVDLQATDLDKTPRTPVELTHESIPVAIHAHGDNVDLVESVVPDCDREFVLGTTQVRPVGPVINVGGFTDGDRAAFLADHIGADALVFPGWDFEDPDVGPEKRRKLRWAERLLFLLERRRGEQFAVLDDRRESLASEDWPWL